jgi:hypothetical protein
MKVNPCKECIVLAMCKGKFIDKDFYGGVIAFSFSVRCILLSEYLGCADQDMIDNVRDVYGLEPYSRAGGVNNDEPM